MLQRASEDVIDDQPREQVELQFGDLIAVFVRSEVASDANTAGRIIERVQGEIDALNPTSYAPDLKLTLSGDVIMAEEEQQTIARELLLATTLTVGTVLLLILLFF